MENLNHKNENTERKYLKIYAKEPIFKGKG